MKVLQALQNYEREAQDWEDELGISLTERISIFQTNLLEFAKLPPVELTSDDIALARFLYYHFWFPPQSLSFETQIDAAIKSFKVEHGSSFYSAGFGRLHILNRVTGLWPRQAEHIADGIKEHYLFRNVTLALITEYSRTSRLMLAMSKGSPVSLGDFNLVLAALKLTSDERSLHVHLVETVAEGEEAGRLVSCGMGSCQRQATWLVGCPHEDGFEYLCQMHKSEDELTFDTFRIIFSGSCRHHAERRDCSYLLVSRTKGQVSIPQIPEDDAFDSTSNWTTEW